MCPSQQPAINCPLSSRSLQSGGDTEMAGVGNLVEEEMPYGALNLALGVGLCRKHPQEELMTKLRPEIQVG